MRILAGVLLVVGIGLIPTVLLGSDPSSSQTQAAGTVNKPVGTPHPSRMVRKSPKKITGHNIALVLDKAASQGMTDLDCMGGNLSRLGCSLHGVQQLLKLLRPCASGTSSCPVGENGEESHAFDLAGLFVFPNVGVGTESREYDCGNASPVIPVNSTPLAGASTYAPDDSDPNAPTYRIVDFSNDYRRSNSDSALNPDSEIARAVDGKAGCLGLKSPGGVGTYFAGAIYAAQAALLGEQASRPGSTNVLVILTDGFSNARGGENGEASDFNRRLSIGEESV